MKARSINSTTGDFTVTVRPQYGEQLAAPCKDGKPQIWMPCCICHKLVSVNPNVISMICDDCYEEEEKEPLVWTPSP